jgi:uncharacterized protein
MPVLAEISAVAMDPNQKVPVVLVKPVDEDRFVPIWIGMMEASAILVAMEGVETPRPMTHDLLCTMLRTVGAEVHKVEICDLREGTFYAELFVEILGKLHRIDSRPSDALALALRMRAPIYLHERVLDQVAIDKAPEGDGVDAVPDGRAKPAVAGALEDDESMRELLEGLDPADFKYRQ